MLSSRLASYICINWTMDGGGGSSTLSSGALPRPRPRPRARVPPDILEDNSKINDRVQRNKIDEDIIYGNMTGDMNVYHYINMVARTNIAIYYKPVGYKPWIVQYKIQLVRLQHWKGKYDTHHRSQVHVHYFSTLRSSDTSCQVPHVSHRIMSVLCYQH